MAPGAEGVATVEGGQSLKNRPPYHKYKSPKKILRIAYLKTSELEGSKSTKCPLGTACVRPKIGQAKNRIKKTNKKTVKRKIALQKTDRTINVATNFV